MDAENASLLTAEQVARLLNLKPSTIYDAASRGRLPCVRLWSGRRRAVVRFVPEEIERVIRSRSVGGSERVGSGEPVVTRVEPDGSIMD